MGADAEAAQSEQATTRRVLAIALPIMLSNVSTPLLGVVDTAVVGRLPGPAPLGAVALGSLIFSFVFWAFGFLRMGTTGLTAQASGAGDAIEVRASLGRALVLALGIGAVIVLLRGPITELALELVHGSPAVETLTRRYVALRIFAAPATLTNFALLGWFIGLGQARTALALQLVLNLSNVVLDGWFVLGLGWGVRGVAAGTLLAEVLAALVGLALAARELRRRGGFGGRATLRRVLDRAGLRRTVAVGGDILLRTLALVFAFAWFTDRGARAGELVLAANAVLLQLVNVAAYFLDGLAFAAETLVGRAVGARSTRLFDAAVRRTTQLAALVALALTLVFALGGTYFVDALTTDPEVRAFARRFLPWAAAGPLAGVWAYQLDGIFIGATRTRALRNAALAATAIFLAGWWLLRGFGNHGLWASLHVHYAARLATLAFALPALRASLRSGPDQRRAA
ncbi:MAG: MATE family efflux transporter [Myxococcota bacterium]